MIGLILIFVIVPATLGALWSFMDQHKDDEADACAMDRLRYWEVK